jgi:hypothetical protein
MITYRVPSKGFKEDIREQEALWLLVHNLRKPDQRGSVVEISSERILLRSSDDENELIEFSGAGTGMMKEMQYVALWFVAIAEDPDTQPGVRAATEVERDILKILKQRSQPAPQ